VRHPEFVQEIEHMRAKWGWTLDHDPYFNSNLPLRDLSISFAFAPAIDKPRRSPSPPPLELFARDRGKQEAGVDE